MLDEEGMTRKRIVEAREIGGRRLFKAERLSSGNWLLIESNGISRRTITNDEFLSKYERVPRNDSETGSGPWV
jgi:hypothetical protein